MICIIVQMMFVRPATKMSWSCKKNMAIIDIFLYLIDWNLKNLLTDIAIPNDLYRSTNDVCEVLYKEWSFKSWTGRKKMAPMDNFYFWLAGI